MSFIGRLIDKDKVKELTDKYNLTRPGFNDSHSLDSHMIAMAYSKKDDAICVSVQSQQGVSLNGQLLAGGIPRINTLIWKGFNIHIDVSWCRRCLFGARGGSESCSPSPNRQ